MSKPASVMRPMTPTPRLVRLLAVLALAVVGLAGGPAVAEPRTAHVHVIDDGNPLFDPAEVVIRKGDTVEWDNHSDRLHTVTHVTCKRADARFDDCEFDSVFDLTPGAFFSHAFSERSGVFQYKCTIHGFLGAITVLDEDGALPDLVVSELEAFDTPLPTAKRLQAVVANVGEGTAIPHKMLFQYQNFDGTWIDIGEPNVPALGPGASIQINQTWQVTGKIGDLPVRAIADHLGTVLEENEDNNTAGIVVPVLLPPGILPGIAAPELP